MVFVPTEEQALLRESAREFFHEKAPVSELRRLRDGKDSLGYSAGLWADMAKLGWAGIVIPEKYGGSGFGFAGLGAVLEEAGRTLAASPLWATQAVAASALILGGNENQKQALLPLAADGELTLALAFEENNHHNPNHIATSAHLEGNHYVINGSKRYVVDGHSADKLIVAARTAGDIADRQGISLFLMDGDAEGLNRTRLFMADSRNAARIDFDNVRVAKDCLIGEADGACDILSAVLDRGRICLSAEMLGGAREVFERTVVYLKEREQFGVKIGSFQALQHRAAKLYCDIELCKSVVRAALTALDENSEQTPRLACLAKTLLNDTYELAAAEAIQMHGGIGMTDELEIGFFLKRSRVAAHFLGDSGFHRDRYATLNGY